MDRTSVNGLRPCSAHARCADPSGRSSGSGGQQRPQGHWYLLCIPEVAMIYSLAQRTQAAPKITAYRLAQTPNTAAATTHQASFARKLQWKPVEGCRPWGLHLGKSGFVSNYVRGLQLPSGPPLGDIDDTTTTDAFNSTSSSLLGQEGEAPRDHVSRPRANVEILARRRPLAIAAMRIMFSTRQVSRAPPDSFPHSLHLGF